jgi:hypothetical protein
MGNSEIKQIKKMKVISENLKMQEMKEMKEINNINLNFKMKEVKSSKGMLTSKPSWPMAEKEFHKIHFDFIVFVVLIKIL